MEDTRIRYIFPELERKLFVNVGLLSTHEEEVNMYRIYLVHFNLTIDYLIKLVYNIDNNIIADIFLYFKRIAKIMRGIYKNEQ